ncbi:ATP-binding cassette domain-containing protein [Mesorhizobium atlanticum]
MRRAPRGRGARRARSCTGGASHGGAAPRQIRRLQPQPRQSHASPRQPGPSLHQPAQAARLAQATIRDLSIKASSTEQPVGRLSGGNQQKVVIGRWLRSKPKVLILDEPTRGVDIGARGEIHRLIRELAGHGMAVLVISSEPDELPDLCDRVLVMAEGRIVRELAGTDLTRSAIIEASYALTEERVPA